MMQLYTNINSKSEKFNLLIFGLTILLFILPFGELTSESTMIPSTTYAPIINILDLLGISSGSSDENVSDPKLNGTINKNNSKDEVTQRTCICTGPACICCVNFNLSYIDFGGPGCVRMKYLSQQDGIAVNVSYGSSLLHSGQVKYENSSTSTTTCMPVLSTFAQICARFNGLQPHNDGLKGCLVLEPHVFGDLTTHLHLGCFNVGPKGMRFLNADEKHILYRDNSSTLMDNNNDDDDDDDGDNNDEDNNNTSEENNHDLIGAINESAEQSLQFLNRFFGLNLEQSQNTTRN